MAMDGKPVDSLISLLGGEEKIKKKLIAILMAQLGERAFNMTLDDQLLESFSSELQKEIYGDMWGNF